MPSITLRFLLTVALFALLTFPAREGQTAEGDAAKLDQLSSEQSWDASIKLARSITTDPDQDEDLTFALARLARGLQNAGQLTAAVEFYQLAVNASELPTASKLAASDKHLVRLAASEVMVQSQNITSAIELLDQLLRPESGISEQQKKIAVWVLLRAGSGSLSRGSYLDASSAYAIALRHADPQQRPIALLGDAWATAVRDEKSSDAVRKLASFVDQYPDHKDAPNAARGCAQCLKQLGRDADSTAMLSDLLNRWPDSSAALAVVRSHCGLSPALIPSAVEFWLMTKATANDLKSFDPSTTMLGLMIAAEKSELIA